jgi:hypothetical protein
MIIIPQEEISSSTSKDMDILAICWEDLRFSWQCYEEYYLWRNTEDYRQQVFLKLWYLCAKLCVVTSQKPAIDGNDDNVLHINVIVFLFQYWYR